MVVTFPGRNNLTPRHHQEQANIPGRDPLWLQHVCGSMSRLHSPSEHVEHSTRTFIPRRRRDDRNLALAHTGLEHSAHSASS